MILRAMAEMQSDNPSTNIVLDMSFERYILEKLCASCKIAKVGISYGHTIVWLTPTESISWMQVLSTFNGNVFIEFEIKSDKKFAELKDRTKLLKELQEYELNDGRYLTKSKRAKRSARLSSLMKLLFDHKCMFCGFSIDELGNGGKDIPTNIALLCPNHHQEMHHGKSDSKEGFKLILKNIIKQYFITEESAVTRNIGRS